MNRRSRQLKNSRWEVERERCRIARPDPPAMRTNAIKLGSILRSLLPEVMRENETLRDELVKQWPEILGRTMAGFCRPGEYQGGILTIYTRGSTALMHLQRFERRHLLIKLGNRLGPEFKDIKLRLDPDPSV